MRSTVWITAILAVLTAASAEPSLEKWKAFWIGPHGGLVVVPKVAPPKEDSSVKSAKVRVVLLTLDGVRIEEFFKNKPDPRIDEEGDTDPTFPNFWAKLAGQGMILGKPGAGGPFMVANPSFVSLPAYRSMMSGRVSMCQNNGCGRIEIETLAERIQRELGLKKKDVAVFSAWSKIAYAFERKEGTLYVKAGPDAHDNPSYEFLDERERYDKDTFPPALEYFKKERPRFFWISLNDSDSHGHGDRYPEYLQSLRQYDAWISQLVEAIDQVDREEGSKTTFFMTTDHGRGKGSRWTDHGTQILNSRFAWLYVRGPTVKGRGIVRTRRKTHADLRPAIEKLFGLEPTRCSTCGTGFGNLIL